MNPHHRSVNLANAFELDTIVSLYRDIFLHWSAEHPSEDILLSAFARTLYLRFTKTGQLVDLEEAISTSREELELQPAPHPNQSDSLSKLAVCFMARWACLQTWRKPFSWAMKQSGYGRHAIQKGWIHSTGMRRRFSATAFPPDGVGTGIGTCNVFKSINHPFCLASILMFCYFFTINTDLPHLCYPLQSESLSSDSV
jgi:hypothetical protein